ncbi:OFA family MFS transporter [Vibrio tubiashii]|uniref:L-lactate MFS transporter n=1 Tax=Vibrio tubiashii TaxID=29498 RepID=UPI001EFCCEC3|nr:OFA family MFS transporter [Vibrio tubiashii]MCG9575270.1 OFA family MFS transporter [Vibrio tubiashii]
MKSRANTILAAGCGINLCIGVLYTWSVFKNALIEMGWTHTEASLPYTITIVTLSLALLVAGRIQDQFGPKRILMVGTFIAGSGMMVSGLSLTPLNLSLSFGALTGTGIGFAYACLNPTAMKWFHPSKKGMVNGVLATAFGLAALYLAPLTTFLISQYGLSASLQILGAGLLLIAFPLACSFGNPPADYSPPARQATNATKIERSQTNIAWREMLAGHSFYLLWFAYAFAAAAGLMIIANITSIATHQANIFDGAYLVIALAIFNSGGRLAAGLLSDKIGAVKTLALAMGLQTVNMLLFTQYDTSLSLIVGAGLAGIGYGTLLAVFPSVMADLYGLKHFGTNYGILYTSWGMGGFIGPVLAAWSIDSFGSYDLSYLICAGLVLIACLLVWQVKPRSQDVVIAQVS